MWANPRAQMHDDRPTEQKELILFKLIDTNESGAIDKKTWNDSFDILTGPNSREISRKRWIEKGGMAVLSLFNEISGGSGQFASISKDDWKAAFMRISKEDGNITKQSWQQYLYRSKDFSKSRYFPAKEILGNSRHAAAATIMQTLAELPGKERSSPSSPTIERSSPDRQSHEKRDPSQNGGGQDLFDLDLNETLTRQQWSDAFFLIAGSQGEISREGWSRQGGEIAAFENIAGNAQATAVCKSDWDKAFDRMDEDRAEAISLQQWLLLAQSSAAVRPEVRANDGLEPELQRKGGDEITTVRQPAVKLNASSGKEEVRSPDTSLLSTEEPAQKAGSSEWGAETF